MLSEAKGLFSFESRAKTEIRKKWHYNRFMLLWLILLVGLTKLYHSYFLSLSSVSTFAFCSCCNLKWSEINRKSHCWQFSKSEMCIQFNFLSIAEKSRQRTHVYYGLNRSTILNLSVLLPKNTVNDSYVEAQVCSTTLRILSHLACGCNWKNKWFSCRNPGPYLSALRGCHSVCMALNAYV